MRIAHLCAPGLLLTTLLVAAPAAAKDRQPSNRPASRPITSSPASAAASPEAVRDFLAALPKLSSDDPFNRTAGWNTISTVCAKASRPGSDHERAALCLAIAEHIGPQSSPFVRQVLIRQLECIGFEEVVPALAEVLKEEDAVIRDCARRALASNPSPQAGNPLRTALAQATEPAWRAALINALAQRGDRQDLSAFVVAAGEADPVVARAGIQALGDLGGPKAVATLSRTGLEPPGMADVVADALLRCADQFAAEGDVAQAGPIYAKLAAPAYPMLVRVAASRGAMLAEPSAAMELARQLLKGDEKPLQDVAGWYVAEGPGDGIARQAAAMLPDLQPPAQAIVVTALGRRADRNALPPVAALAKSSDQALRLAVWRALGALGDASTVPLLAEAAAGSSGAEQAAARDALVSLEGQAIDAAIVQGLDAPQPRVRAELVKALADRRVTSAVPALLSLVEKDAEPMVGTAALDGLAALATDAQAPDLLRLVCNAADDAHRSAAEKALAAVIGRSEDRPALSHLLLDAWAAADAPAGQMSERRAALIRLLSRVAGQEALTAVDRATDDADAEVRGAAIRAIAGWPDAAALDSALRLARTQENTTYKVLALQGFIRMAGLPATRSVTETLGLYRQALELAARPEEVKQVLGGLGQVADPVALELIDPLLAREVVAPEAVQAKIAVAKAIAAQRPEAARDALRQVLALDMPPNSPARRQAQDVLDKLPPARPPAQ